MRRWNRLILVLAVALTLLAALRSQRVPVQAPMPPNGFEVLDAQRLGQRSVEVFPTAYMTLLSIAQGVALGTLVTAGALEFHTATVDEILPLTLEILASVSAVLVVYYMYVWFVLVFRWAPGVLDSVIPLALGGVEIVLAISVGNHKQWLVALTALMFAGGLAFMRSIWRSDESLFSDPQAHATILKLLNWLAALCIGGGVLYTVGLALLEWIGLANLVFATTAITMVMLFLMLATSERGMKNLYTIYGLTRWPPRRR